MAEGARLESVYRGNSIQGSNPSSLRHLSTIEISAVCRFVGVESPHPIARALRFLAQARNQDGGWPYTPGQPSRPEASCYASLAVPDARSNCAWIDKQKDAPPWTKSLQLFTLRRLGGSTRSTQKQLVETLLGAQVQQTPTDKKLNDVDGSLRGWSWVDGTFSWVSRPAMPFWPSRAPESW